MATGQALDSAGTKPEPRPHRCLDRWPWTSYSRLGSTTSALRLTEATALAHGGWEHVACLAHVQQTGQRGGQGPGVGQTLFQIPGHTSCMI